MDTDVYLTVCRGVSQYPSKYGAPQGSQDSTSGRASIIARHVDDIHPLHFTQRVYMDVLVGVRDMTDKRREMTGATPLDVRSQSPQQYATNWGGVVEPRKHLELRNKNPCMQWKQICSNAVI